MQIFETDEEEDPNENLENDSFEDIENDDDGEYIEEEKISE